jgi:hypothetical protein
MLTLPIESPSAVTIAICEQTKEGYEMHIEQRDHLKGLNYGESTMTVSVPSLFRNLMGRISRKSKTLLCLAHVCIGCSLLVYGYGVTGIPRIVTMVLGCVMAVPFVENMVWLATNAFYRKS